MVQGPSFSAIATLGDASAPVTQQLDVTKGLKNLIIGQYQRKESAVKNGIVKPLADILSAAVKATGKRRLDASYPARSVSSSQRNPEDELRLQAALIVASLATGGPAFVHPLCSANVPDVLIQTLAADIAPQLTVAVLQALKALAVNCSAALESNETSAFWTSVLSEESVKSLDEILHAGSSQQVRLVTEIISLLPDSGVATKTCKSTLTNYGVLDTLAALLASYAAQHGIVWSHVDASQLPPPPPTKTVPSILAAISAIIIGSNYRAHRFIHSPSIRDLFANANVETSEPRGAFGPRQGFANSHEPLLPPLHIPSYRTVSHHQPTSSNFPALRSMQFGKQGYRPLEPAQLSGDIDQSNAVCSWLLVFARSLQGLDRLTALRLLSLIVNAVETDTISSSCRAEHLQKTLERERQLAFLAVPLAVNLVQYANEGKTKDFNTSEQHDIHDIREQACAVLASLISGSKELQIAAVSAGAIKHVCPMLKKSFDNVTFSKPMWSGRAGHNDLNAPETSRLGSQGLPSEILHAMRCRQSALEALAALAAQEDSHRKAIVESGVINTIIESLKPFPPNILSGPSNSRPPPSPRDGNTIQVILAACRAAQSMSRSVSVLRTSLIDGGIAKPLMDLLNHGSLEVQIAATDVCCNLLPEFSPMREDLLQNNVVRTLTGHAKSSSPGLRLSSLWALKHLMCGCTKEVKITTLEELGAGWLVGIIQGEQRDSDALSNGASISVGLSSANAAGERVDLLNPSSMDIDEPGMTNEDMMDDEDEDGEVLYDEASSTHYQSSQLRSTLNPPPPTFNSKKYLSSIREMEQNDEYTAKRDEVAIQQQALDFIRNLINGPDDCTVMSDHIISQIGSAKVYELLTSKLSPLPKSVSGGRVVYGPTELVLSTIHVIIHLANSARHRQMLIAQKPLLLAMLPHFNHLDHRVRVMSVWAVNSLTWIEGDDDREDARQRVKELRLLGIEQAVRALQNDPVQDVRERVKTSIRQFELL